MRVRSVPKGPGQNSGPGPLPSEAPLRTHPSPLGTCRLEWHLPGRPQRPSGLPSKLGEQAGRGRTHYLSTLRNPALPDVLYPRGLLCDRPSATSVRRAMWGASVWVLLCPFPARICQSGARPLFPSLLFSSDFKTHCVPNRGWDRKLELLVYERDHLFIFFLKGICASKETSENKCIVSLAYAHWNWLTFCFKKSCRIWYMGQAKGYHQLKKKEVSLPFVWVITSFS